MLSGNSNHVENMAKTLGQGSSRSVGENEAKGAEIVDKSKDDSSKSLCDHGCIRVANLPEGATSERLHLLLELGDESKISIQKFRGKLYASIAAPISVCESLMDHGEIRFHDKVLSLVKLNNCHFGVN